MPSSEKLAKEVLKGLYKKIASVSKKIDDLEFYDIANQLRRKYRGNQIYDFGGVGMPFKRGVTLIDEAASKEHGYPVGLGKYWDKNIDLDEILKKEVIGERASSKHYNYLQRDLSKGPYGLPPKDLAILGNSYHYYPGDISAETISRSLNKGGKVFVGDNRPEVIDLVKRLLQKNFKIEKFRTYVEKGGGPENRQSQALLKKLATLVAFGALASPKEKEE